MSQATKEELILQMRTDKMILRHVYDKSFTVRFLDRSEQRNRFQPSRKGELVWYADGSKTDEGTGDLVYGYDRRKNLVSALDSTPQ
jgi:hypothetical protein